MEEKVYFKDQEGVNLCGVISNPTSDKTKPIIIFCHGFASSKESHTYQSLGDILNKNNISTFKFDFWGHGESEGKFEEITVSKAVKEALSAISFIKKQGYSKIGLMGSSFGGLVSIITASKNNDLFVLTLKSPVSSFGESMDYGKWKEIKKEAEEKGYTFYINSKGGKLRLNQTFFEDAESINGYELAKNIKTPTLIVHGDEDRAVRIEQSKKTVEIIPNCKLEIIKGADHRYTEPEHFEKLMSLISQFIIKNI